MRFIVHICTYHVYIHKSIHKSIYNCISIYCIHQSIYQYNSKYEKRRTGFEEAEAWRTKVSKCGSSNLPFGWHARIAGGLVMLSQQTHCWCFFLRNRLCAKEDVWFAACAPKRGRVTVYTRVVFHVGSSRSSAINWWSQEDSAVAPLKAHRLPGTESNISLMFDAAWFVVWVDFLWIFGGFWMFLGLNMC